MIGVIDYGMGNLHSVLNACEHLGLEAIASADKDVLSKCDKLILPGVGAFGDMIDCLEKTGLKDWIAKEVSENKKPVLGICLGMQALFEKSYEYGEYEGFGFLKGEVRPMNPYDVRIPQIGWNSLEISTASPFSSFLKNGCYVYFDHSYVVEAWDPACLIAYCQYGPYTVPAIVGKDNVLGTQFHPEKSGKDGLKILEWFGKEFYADSSRN